MTQTQKPAVAAPLPEFTVFNLDGNPITPSASTGKWQLLIIYRGKHCGRCKTYLGKLEAMQSQWQDAGFDILAVSADPVEKAKADIADHGWTFPVAYGLGETDMHRLGLYVSDPLSPEETDRRFAEPALFCIRPDGNVHIAAIANGPSARPDLDALLDGIKFTIEHDKPVRGTVN